MSHVTLVKSSRHKFYVCTYVGNVVECTLYIILSIINLHDIHELYIISLSHVTFVTSYVLHDVKFIGKRWVWKGGFLHLALKAEIMGWVVKFM